MKPKIIVVGSANTDMVVKVKHLPAPGETVLGGNYMQARGGKGANQAVAAARLGGDVTFIARLGRDTLGKESALAYQEEGINTDYVVWDDHAPSGVALILVNQVGENIIAVASGANARLSPADIMAAEDAFYGAACMLVQLEIPIETVEAAIRLSVKHRVPVILNPAPANQLSSDVLELVDYLTPNLTEAAALAGCDPIADAESTAHLIRSKFSLRNLIITLGKDGVLLRGLRNERVPAYPVKPVDTTGAGDAFNGALAVALGRGDDLIDAVRFANAAAALSTTCAGAQPSMPTLEEVRAFYNLCNSRQSS